MNPWVEHVYKTIQSNGLVHEGDTVLVGLSGGADSVALLRTMLDLKEPLQLRAVHAAHLHHGLRGESADRDERFVRRLCESLQIPLTVSRVDVAKEAALNKESLEEAGRRLRYEFFDAVADSLGGTVRIAVAHNSDDLAETVLFRIMRGTALKGLGGIPMCRGRIIRPLLNISSASIREYCLQQHFEYVLDETNEQTIFSRNRIRHVVLPEMEAIHRGAVDNMVRLSRIAAEEDTFLQQQTQELIRQATLDSGYDAALLRDAPTVLARRALIELLWNECQLRADFRQAEAMLQIVRNGGRYGGLPERAVVSCDRDVLVFHSKDRYATAMEASVLKLEEQTVFDTVSVCPRLINYDEFERNSKIHKNFLYYCADYDKITGSMTVHSRRSDDMLLPSRSSNRKPLKKWFNEWNIPIPLRLSVPIVSDDDGVVAVLGYAVDQRVSVTPTSRRIVWFQCTKINHNEKDEGTE